MPQKQRQAIAKCTNPKCNKPIWDDHSYSWCIECGEPLTPDIQSKVPELQKLAASAKARLGSLDETVVRNAQGAIVPVSNQVSALMHRYSDAYIVASATNGFGGLIKGIGVLIAILLIVIGLGFISQGRFGDATFALGVVTSVAGILAGVWFYIVGVLVAAQGQILKASLDSAVNGSPFLKNEHKAKIMSLPQA